MTAQTFHLPFPPTANTMWRHVRAGQHYLSERYRKWRDEAGKELIVQKVKKVRGPVRITIGLCPPTKTPWDIDNRIKPVLDLLVNCMILEEDNSEIVKEITAHVNMPGLIGTQVTITPVSA